MLGPLLLPEPMSWHRRATWEWCMVKPKGCMTVAAPPPNVWNDCTAGTCTSLDGLQEMQLDEVVGKRVRFNDSYGVTRIFTCLGSNGGSFVLRHPQVKDEGEVVLLVRQISLKLLRATYKADDMTISVDSAISGNQVFAVPYEEHSRMSWGMFTEIVNKKCKLADGRVVLFPADVTEPEEMEAWKAKPRVRVQVRSLLKVVAKEHHDRKKRYVRKNAVAKGSLTSTSSSSTSKRT